MVSSCGPDVRAPFSLSSNLTVLDWRLATRGFIFCQHVHANTRRPLLIGTDSLSGKIQPSSSEPSTPWWVEISCRLVQEVKEQRGMKGGARKKEGHALLGLIAVASTEQWPLCVYMWHIISDKVILGSSLSPCPLVATPPAPLPLLSLCLCTQRPLPR